MVAGLAGPLVRVYFFMVSVTDTSRGGGLTGHPSRTPEKLTPDPALTSLMKHPGIHTHSPTSVLVLHQRFFLFSNEFVVPRIAPSTIGIC